MDSMAITAPTIPIHPPAHAKYPTGAGNINKMMNKNGSSESDSSSSGDGGGNIQIAIQSEGEGCNDINGGTTTAATTTVTTPALSSSSSSSSSALPQSRRESEASASKVLATTIPTAVAQASVNNSNDKVSSTTSTATNIEITPTTVTQQHHDSVNIDDDDDIIALTKGLGSVSLAPSTVLPHRQKGEHVLPPLSATDNIATNAPEAIKQLATMLSSKKKYTNIVILTGAGISCNAGIPDFRTPGSGLYDNLQKYNLPHPTAVFDLDFYKCNPSPFVQLASELWPGMKHSPTVTHSFIALLERKGLLLRNYTQNIDMLDVLAGVSEDKMIECHGHFRTASCTSCSRPFDGKECKHIIVEKKRAPVCKACGGYVKPDIVFFGEDLPSKYHKMVKHDMKKADLLIVMGTSLMVGPVNMIPEMVSKRCPRVLLNRELAGTFLKRNGPSTRRMSYDSSVQRDIFHQGDCDASIRTLCGILGWENELLELNLSTRLGGRG